MKEPEPLDELLEDLQSADAQLRKTAAEELGRWTPAEPRTFDALTIAAKADEDEAVRSAAAKSHFDLTGAEVPPPSGETAATVTETPTTSSGSRVLQSAGRVVLAATLTILGNIAACIVAAMSGNGNIVTIAVFLIIDLIVAILVASKRQFSVAAGIAVGLVVCALTIGIGLYLMLYALGFILSRLTM